MLSVRELRLVAGVVGVAGEDGEGAVDLFGEDGAGEFVGQGERPKERMRSARARAAADQPSAGPMARTRDCVPESRRRPRRAGELLGGELLAAAVEEDRVRHGRGRVGDRAR